LVAVLNDLSTSLKRIKLTEVFAEILVEYINTTINKP
jgi:hypothetical protein